MKHAIEIEGLTKRFGSRSVLSRFDLVVEPGETLAILGASGCGKSTLLRCIAGLVQPDDGAIAIRDELGFVFQEPRLMPWLTVEKNVAFAARSDAERARVNEVLALVGLSPAAHLLPKELSGGMAQRAALARTLVRNPKILLLDEPLSALDALLRLELQEALASIIRETGSTAVLVTHDVQEALYLADRIIVLAGAPARGTLEMTVPPSLRRARYADLTDERVALLAALGIEHRPGAARAHRGLRIVAP
jgi:ABC-type nitrate/sulfonate/bicarbonate transport system ATPase subunit